MILGATLVMQPLSEIRALLAANGLSPLKSLGQNFLIDHNLIRKLADAAAIRPGELVLEIGPGTGTLTEELLARGAHVIAAELDQGLAALLRARFVPPAYEAAAFTLIEGDCLRNKHALSEAIVRAVADRPFVLVANLPYDAGTPAMTVLLADFPLCRGLFVTIQYEVAQRLAARAGTREFGAISVLAQTTSTIEIIAKAPPGCFWPQPGVHSALVAIRRRAEPLCESPGPFSRWCQRLLEKRRKQLGAVLERNTAWPAGIDPIMRAETLTIDQLIALWRIAGEQLPERA